MHLHTHLAETQDEEAFCLQMFGYKPVAYMQQVDWIGEDVWFAHSVHVNPEEIDLYAHTGCGVAHCPSSNMRLASGIAPILEMLKAGVKVGLGVDGSASNDSSHMLAEARQAMLLARIKSGLEGASLSGDDAPPLMTATQALSLATRGGAAVLGRTDIGSLEVGKCADLVAINLNRLEYTGALARSCWQPQSFVHPLMSITILLVVKSSWKKVSLPPWMFTATFKSITWHLKI